MHVSICDIGLQGMNWLTTMLTCILMQCLPYNHPPRINKKLMLVLLPGWLLVAGTAWVRGIEGQ